LYQDDAEAVQSKCEYSGKPRRLTNHKTRFINRGVRFGPIGHNCGVGYFNEKLAW